MVFFLAALNSIQHQVDDLFDRYPTMAQVAVIQRSTKQSCEQLSDELVEHLDNSRSGLILIGCKQVQKCMHTGRITQCPGAPLSTDKASLFSWYGDLLFEGQTAGFSGILLAKDQGAPQVAIETKDARNQPDKALAEVLRNGMKNTRFRLVPRMRNAQTAAQLQDRWMATAMNGGSACALGRDRTSTHLIKAKLGGRHASQWLRLTLSGSESNCALASVTLRLGRKPLSQGVHQAIKSLLKQTHRPIRIGIESPRGHGPDRILLAQAEITLGCQPTRDPGCKRHESPNKKLRVDAFMIDRTEVTVAAYRQCVEAKKCQPPFVFNVSCNWSRKNAESHPMNCVSWQQARQFCAAQKGHLPTEAQWARAARGSSARLYAWGDQKPTCKRAMMRTTEPGCGLRSTAPVASRPLGRTPEGVDDLTGNVAEWVEDAYSGNGFNPQTKPVEDTDVERIQRGGSWYRSATDLRAGHRERHPAGRRGPGVGFRCAYKE